MTDYGPAIDAFLNERNGAARVALEQASSGSADAAARARQIADSTGIPWDVVQRNPDLAQRADYAARIDGFLKGNTNPKFAGWLTTNAALVHDDLDNIGAIGQAADAVKSFVPGVIKAAGSTLTGWREANTSAARLMVGGLRSVGAGGLADALEAPVLPWWASLSGILGKPGEALKSWGDALKPTGNSFGSQVGDALGQVGMQIGLAAATGGLSSAASVGTMLGQGFDQMAEDAREHGAAGTTAGDVATLAGGPITATAEKVGLDLLMKAPPQLRSRLLTYLTGIGLKVASEATQEATEQTAQNAAAKLAYDPNRDLTEGVGQSAEVGGAVGGLVEMLLGALPGKHRVIVTRDLSGARAVAQADAARERERATDMASRSCPNITRRCWATCKTSCPA